MKKSFAVFGLGKFGRSVAIELAEAGAEVLAIDINEEKVREIASYVTCAMKADVCDAETLQSLGLSNMDGVVVAITENRDASIMATIVSKEEGVPFVLSKSADSIHATVLKKIGADKVLVPEKESGIRTARHLLVGNILEFIELSEDVKMIEIETKKEWIGKTLRQLDLRKKHNINVVCVRKNKKIILNLDPDTPLTDEYSLIIVVEQSQIKKLMRR